MDLQEAVQFVAAIVIIIGSGIALGIDIQRRAKGVPPHMQNERVRTYSEIIEAMDGLREADNAHKQHFIQAYYRLAVYAPDKVVRALNQYLLVITVPENEFDAEAQAAARDAAVHAMRSDAQAQAGKRNGMKPNEIFSIEVNTETAPVIKPDAQVDPGDAFAQPKS